MRGLWKLHVVDLFQAFQYVILRLTRFYNDYVDKLTSSSSVTDKDQATKDAVDATCSQAWRLVYPLIKNHLCTANMTGVSS